MDPKERFSSYLEQKGLLRPNPKVNGRRNLVVCRNVMYTGFCGRLSLLANGPLKHYFLDHLSGLDTGPFIKILHEILGAFIFFISIPILPILFTLLFLERKLRAMLIRWWYPDAIVSENYSVPNNGKCQKTVTSVVWLRDRVDVLKIKEHFESQSIMNPLLRRRLKMCLGLPTWLSLESEASFDIHNHVRVAPSQFYQSYISDDSPTSYYGKTTLQQYVTSCASDLFDTNMPPWQITLIPQMAHSKDKTCCVLRFHHVLLNHPSIYCILQQLFQCPSSWFPQHAGFGETVLLPQMNMKLSTKENQCFNLSTSNDNLTISVIGENRKNADADTKTESHQPNQSQTPMTSSDLANESFHRLSPWTQLVISFSRYNYKIWLNFQLKQLQTNKATFTGFLCSQCVRAIESIRDTVQQIPFRVVWNYIVQMLLKAAVLVRAVSHLPLIIIHCLKKPKKDYIDSHGFRRNEKAETRQVAWSSPISIELLELIQEKSSNASFESILLAVCSLGLEDYFRETCLPNPKTVDVAVSCVSGNVLSPSGFHKLKIPSMSSNITSEIQNMNAKLKSYPRHLVLSRRFLARYLSRFLPRFMSDFILRRLITQCPVAFNYINMEVPDAGLVNIPYITLWNHSVEDLTNWSSAQSDHCISLTVVRYSNTLRLTVMSPVKAIDSFLTCRFQHHVNNIALSVGMDRSQIPISTSRRSSPSQSYCASPSVRRAMSCEKLKS